MAISFEEFSKLHSPQGVQEEKEIKNVFTFEELITDETTEDNPIIEGVLDPGELAIISGYPKTKKTFMAIQMAVETALGKNLFRVFPTAGGPTCFVSLEEGIRGIKKKLRFLYPDLKEFPNTMFYFPSSFSLEELENILRKDNPILVVIDNLGLFLSGLEEKRGSAYEDEYTRLNTLKELLKKYPWTSIVLLHHKNKQGQYLGTTAIKAVPDVFWEIEKRNDYEGDEAVKVEGEFRNKKALNFVLDFQEGEGFSYAGEPQDTQVRKTSELILKLLEENEEKREWKRKEIFSALKEKNPEIQEPTMDKALKSLLKQGHIQKLKRGVYTF
ncbi:MAG: AAA family ATPase [Conexivisphaerales archaeon]